MTEAKPEKAQANGAEAAQPAQQPAENLLEADDLFEEFSNEDWNAAKGDEDMPLWEADWEDENRADDFAARLRSELDRGMKE